MDSRSPSRRSWLQACVAGTLVSLLRPGFAAAAMPAVSGMQRMRGEVSVNGRPAAIGQAIGAGDELATGAGAEAVFVIGQDAFLLRDSSIVRFLPAPALSFMRVVSGKILSVFGPGEKRISVSTAVIGIRGTACYIEDSGSRTYFCLCYGEADVIPLAAPQQREIIRTRHHDHPIYIDNDPAMPKSMVPAEVLNHTDAELALLESLVGRVPPFAGTSY